MHYGSGCTVFVGEQKCLPNEYMYYIIYMYFTCVCTGNSENKRLRKPTKRLLESTEEYEQIFVTKKKSKKRTSEPPKMVRWSFRLLVLLYSVKISHAK